MSKSTKDFWIWMKTNPSLRTLFLACNVADFSFLRRRRDAMRGAFKPIWIPNRPPLDRVSHQFAENIPNSFQLYRTLWATHIVLVSAIGIFLFANPSTVWLSCDKSKVPFPRSLYRTGRKSVKSVLVSIKSKNGRGNLKNLDGKFHSTVDDWITVGRSPFCACVFWVENKIREKSPTWISRMRVKWKCLRPQQRLHECHRSNLEIKCHFPDASSLAQ